MPFRIDLHDRSDTTFDRLLALGALDVEPIEGGIAAIMPDSVSAASIAAAIGASDVPIAPARGRDDGSVWVVNRRPVRVGRVEIVPADWPPRPGTLRMIDGPAFGTGLHPTTALCLEALDAALGTARPASVLDVGTGSGVLALAALCSGVPRAVAVDIAADAVDVAAANARLNGLQSRLHVVQGGPEALRGSWPLVMANVLTAPLIEMAPAMTRCVGRGGRLVLSGIRSSLAGEVERAYRRRGMHPVHSAARGGWTALTLHASW
jgi:ribosomal protein L11 methyltransferase